jgi:hypothetical protein
VPPGTVAPPGSVAPPGTATPPGTVTPPGSNYVICNSDICPFPYTCKNNQCVSPCSPTNCLSPKVCDGNNNCITPICTPEQIVRIFPLNDDYMGSNSYLSNYGPCTGIDDKYLSFDKTYGQLTVNNTVIPTTTADDCKTACDKNPSCTAWIHGSPYSGPIATCQLSTSKITYMEPLNQIIWEVDSRGQFNYNKDSKSVYSTNVKLSALE